MKRKAYAVGLLATALTAVAVVPPCYSYFASSRESFQQYFQDLDPKGNSLNPVERFVFSLVLAHSASAPNRK